MSAYDPKQTLASALNMSGESRHDFLRRKCLLLTQSGHQLPSRASRKTPAGASRTHPPRVAWTDKRDPRFSTAFASRETASPLRIASGSGAVIRKPRHRAARAPPLFLLAAAHEQRALSDHRPDGTRRWTGARRHPASEARQARCGARADLDLDPRCRALCRDAVAAQRWTLSRARADSGAAP